MFRFESIEIAKRDLMRVEDQAATVESAPAKAEDFPQNRTALMESSLQKARGPFGGGYVLVLMRRSPKPNICRRLWTMRSLSVQSQPFAERHLHHQVRQS
ncbi:MAG: hypothetical protein WBD22_05240 [Pyrinomonadaceae bacterium]